MKVSIFYVKLHYSVHVRVSDWGSERNEMWGAAGWTV